MKGVNPEWATLPRRKCDDCGKSYKPKQPLRENERGFCSATCRKAYHKHGGAYRKLRVEVQKLFDKKMQEFTARFDIYAIDARLVALEGSKPAPLPNRSRRAPR